MPGVKKRVQIITKIKQQFIRVLSTAALLLGFVCLLGLIYALIQNPKLFVSTKNVVSFVFEILLLGKISAYFIKRLKQGIEKYGNFTRALVRLISQEPLIHSLMWIFIFFVGIYILPIHYVEVKIYDRESSQPVKATLIESAEIIKGAGAVGLSAEDGPVATFTSKRFLTWGDSAGIEIKARGYKQSDRLVPWSAFAFLDVFRGNRQKIFLTKETPDSVKITLTVNPASARIIIESPVGTAGHKAVGATAFVARTDKSVKINVSLNCYVSFDTTLVASQDVDLQIGLNPKPGRVVLRALKENGEEIKSISIFINKKRIPEKTGEWITRPAGIYNLRLFERLDENLAYEFRATIKISSCEETIKEFTLQPQILTSK